MGSYHELFNVFEIAHKHLESVNILWTTEERDLHSHQKAIICVVTSSMTDLVSESKSSGTPNRITLAEQSTDVEYNEWW